MKLSLSTMSTTNSSYHDLNQYHRRVVSSCRKAKFDQAKGSLLHNPAIFGPPPIQRALRCWDLGKARTPFAAKAFGARLQNEKMDKGIVIDSQSLPLGGEIIVTYV